MADCDDRWLRRIAIGIVALMAAVDWAFALPALRHAPAVHDLYHLVYPGSGRRRGEDGVTFLIGFPAIVTLGAISMPYRHVFGSTDRQRVAGSTALTLFVMGGFTVAAIVRANAVLSLFP